MDENVAAGDPAEAMSHPDVGDAVRRERDRLGVEGPDLDRVVARLLRRLAIAEAPVANGALVRVPAVRSELIATVAEWLAARL